MVFKILTRSISPVKKEKENLKTIFNSRVDGLLISLFTNYTKIVD